jgi:uncharacterized protein (TIGR03790 family)
MMKITIAAILCCLVTVLADAEISYKDVAVIINANSTASQIIGNYFAAERGIPTANKIYVQVDTTEEIDSTMFNLLRSQVESHLLVNNLRDSINYLVTTKGVPLKVNRGSTFSISSPSSSVESELMLIHGSYATHIGKEGAQISPYFYQNAPFSRSVYGIYLVTRLDGYSVNDILALIDRSGPNVAVSNANAVVLDQDPARISSLNTYLATARTILADRGKSVLFDSTSVYQTYKHNLLGYVSWGSNDNFHHMYTQYAIPHNTYTPGAIAETYVSTSARSFTSPPSYGQSLIADLIAEGISGVKGYVYEPYSNAIARPHVLFDRYFSSYSLAESYFMASYLISWMDVVIGDPKTSITFSTSLPVQLAGFAATVLQPLRAIRFEWRTISETNNYGFILQRAEISASSFVDVPNSFVAGNGTTVEPRSYSWTYYSAPAGTFRYRLKQVDLDGTEHFSDPIVVTNDVVAGIGSNESLDFALHQNFPNPFNPTTTIRFVIPTAGKVLLKIYDVTGREVATLVDTDLPAGTHQREFDGSALASGMYIYKLTTGEKTEQRKLLMMK